MDVKLDVSEMKVLVDKMEAMLHEAEDFMSIPVVVVGETIMTDVKASRPGAGVPKDSGDLARSGRVVHRGRQKWADLTFGGPAAPYALVQHENTEFHHKLGEARYLIRGMERVSANGDADKALGQMVERIKNKGKKTSS